MKHGFVSLSLTLLLFLNLTGCTSTAAIPDEPNKSTEDIVTVVPTTPTPPHSPAPETASTENPKIPDAKRQVPTPTVVADEPKELALPQGPIALRTGAVLPEFTLVDLKGNETSASSIIAKHNLTLINFWTTT